MLGAADDLVVAGGGLIYLVLLIGSLVLMILWIMIPFILMRIQRNTLRAADELHRVAAALASANRQNAAISQQLDYLVKAKAAELEQQV